MQCRVTLPLLSRHCLACDNEEHHEKVVGCERLHFSKSPNFAPQYFLLHIDIIRRFVCLYGSFQNFPVTDVKCFFVTFAVKMFPSMS